MQVVLADDINASSISVLGLKTVKGRFLENPFRRTMFRTPGLRELPLIVTPMMLTDVVDPLLYSGLCFPPFPRFSVRSRVWSPLFEGVQGSAYCLECSWTTSTNSTVLPSFGFRYSIRQYPLFLDSSGFSMSRHTLQHCHVLRYGQSVFPRCHPQTFVWRASSAFPLFCVPYCSLVCFILLLCLLLLPACCFSIGTFPRVVSPYMSVRSWHCASFPLSSF